MFRMPGQSYKGELPDLTDRQLELENRLRKHVRVIAGDIGERNLLLRPGNLEATEKYLRNKFQSYGYDPKIQEFSVKNEIATNVFARLPGEIPSEGLVVIGAHYDTIRGSPGANDNASGIAALLEIARRMEGTETDRTVVFACFVNEEPPYFKTENMGSYRFAQGLAEHDKSIRAMISLETIGYFSNESGSQNYPPGFGYFYPDRGNFLGFVGNLWHGDLLRETLRVFRQESKFPSEGVTAPWFVPGISWSDHQSFWKMGYPAIMVTDTALYRYPHYHTPSDTPAKIQYEKLARVTSGLTKVIHQLAKE